MANNLHQKIQLKGRQYGTMHDSCCSLKKDTQISCVKEKDHTSFIHQRATVGYSSLNTAMVMKLAVKVIECANVHLRLIIWQCVFFIKNQQECITNTAGRFDENMK